MLENKLVIYYRTIVFLIAIFYWLYQFSGILTDPFGWQFRYLTIWSLTASTLVAAQLLGFSLGLTNKNWNSLASAATVISMVVVIQYWRLHFTDPKLVGSGSIPWHQQYYLHLLGPMLLWIDAFFILGSFSNLKRILFLILIFSITYPLWMEVILQPINTIPSGTVTNGLPYPFLNDMEVFERFVFYLISIMLNFLLIYFGWFLSNVLFLKFRNQIHNL
jgi:hypothetical protein